MTSKHDLRRTQRALRLTLADQARDAALAAAGHLPSGLHPAVVGGYLPAGGELDPGPVLKVLQDRGALLAMPVCLAPEAPLLFRAYCPGDALAPDVMGMSAPTEAASILVPDILIIPLLAFDRQGGRLGQGGGFYDRTLQALRQGGQILAIGLAHAGQEVDCVPMGEFDQSLDAILTETGYILPKTT
jgi:5-formyltetrahydrofolate cyclo-ligase